MILDYLDDRAGGGKIVPRDAKARLAALRLQALCDGILDASILTVYESALAAGRNTMSQMARTSGRQGDARARGARSCAAARCRCKALPNVGQIALACVLGYRDLRFGGEWRADHPRLVAWLDNFAARVPGYAATKVTV